MSMTREEAIYTIERLAHAEAKWPGTEDTLEALDLAITALLPVSREQVEKVWRGEWIGDNDEKVGTIEGSPIKSSTCSACGNWLVGSDEYDCAGYFCPTCGSAMTDEAVQMVMERINKMEGMENESC